MPNHITSRLRVSGPQEDVDKMFATIAGVFEDGTPSLMDFNKIIPMPEDLDISSDSISRDAANYIRLMAGEEPFSRLGIRDYTDGLIERMEEAKAENPESFEKQMERGRQYIENYKKYGAPTWYEWRLDHWGTKWNAYECERWDDNTISWQTAWNGVPDLMSKLSPKCSPRSAWNTTMLTRTSATTLAVSYSRPEKSSRTILPRMALVKHTSFVSHSV